MASIRQRSKKSGLPPGSLIHVGHEATANPILKVYTLTDQGCEEREITGSELAAARKPGQLQWFDLQGTHDSLLMQTIGEVFGIHPLVIEDVMNTAKRPKFEDLGEYLFILAKMLYPAGPSGGIHAEQVSLIIGDGWVLSCQEQAKDTFDPIRDRLRTGRGRMRGATSDFLGYSLLDSIIDNYFVVLERLGDELEQTEQRIMQNTGGRAIAQIYRMKRTVLFIRRAIWPLREAMVNFERSESPIIRDTSRIFLRDAYDHTVEVIDIVENYRDSYSALLDTYLSSMSNRLNSTMMILTLVTTIFMPLTFIAGIYGMNFEHMPELKWRYGYPLVLSVMAAIAGGMLLFFRKQRWL